MLNAFPNLLIFVTNTKTCIYLHGKNGILFAILNESAIKRGAGGAHLHLPSYFCAKADTQ